MMNFGVRLVPLIHILDGQVTKMIFDSDLLSTESVPTVAGCHSLEMLLGEWSAGTGC